MRKKCKNDNKGICKETCICFTSVREKETDAYEYSQKAEEIRLRRGFRITRSEDD